MEQLFVELLKLLDLADQEVALNKFRSKLEPDNRVEFVESSKKSVDLEFPNGSGLNFREEASGQLKEFFQCWVDRFFQTPSDRRDELTGLYTRSYWERELKDKLQGRTRSFAMVDIDHFKRFNDNYGHQVGDQVLEAVGQTVEGLLEEEVAVRYGGEEILIASPRKLVELETLLEAIRNDVSRPKLFQNQPEQITVSAGLAEFTSPAHRPEKIIERADLALYSAKENGRDRCRTYAPYMSRSLSFYIWGVYRYLWGPKICFALNNSDFLLAHGEVLLLYNWYNNSGKEVQLPNSFAGLPRCMLGVGGKFFLLDLEGEFWRLEADSNWQKLSENSDPELISLIGDDEHLFGVGINNQLYKVEQRQLVHYRSLPEEWEQLAFANGIYYLDQDHLYQAGIDDRTPEFVFSEPVVQIVGSGNNLYALGNSGTIHRYQTETNNWANLKLVNRQYQIRARELTVNRDKLLLRDAAGRLLFVRSKGKSVPQEMDI